MTNSLTLGCDCLGVIHYFDVAYVAPTEPPCASRTRSACTRRTTGCSGSTPTSAPGTSRCAAVAPRDLDHRHRRQLRVRVLLVPAPGRHDRSARSRRPGSSPPRRSPRASARSTASSSRRNLNAIHHQHIFCARLDFDLDGGRTRSSRSTPSREPHGPRESARQRVDDRRAAPATRARGEPRYRSDAGAHMDGRQPGATQRTSASRSAIGSCPGENTVPFCDSRLVPARRRAASSTTTSGSRRTPPTSATRPASTRISTAAATGCRAGPRRIAASTNTDVVVWYTMNHHHVPRPEDWPVMPVARIGFAAEAVGLLRPQPRARRPPTRARLLMNAERPGAGRAARTCPSANAS